jgi:DNA processing protein
MTIPATKASYRSQALNETASSVEKLAFLALGSIRGVGYWTLFNMARAGVSFSSFVEIEDGDEATQQLKKFGARLSNKPGDWRTVRSLAFERATKTCSDLEQSMTRVVFSNSAEFPPSLRDLNDAPQWLFVQGNVDVLHRPCLTVVGTREPSADGLWLANFVGANFSIWDAPTVSGLALGIDQMVHRWSLRNRVPTIAFLGAGIFSDYPKGSVDLRTKIIDEGGAIVTEYLPSESYSAENFVRRNRLQAALGSVLIPVEWSPKSGTAHTVRYASSLSRPVAGLRLPDWSPIRVSLPKNPGGAEIFTIPGYENGFREFVMAALKRPSSPVEFLQRDFFN